jgi:3-oxoacyl-[acyl-carrier protein] reductase
VNAVCPGYFMTDRVKELLEHKAKKTKKGVKALASDITSQIPLKRMGNPDELADLIVYLASDRSSYITGSVIQVDGGFVKGAY